MKAKRFLSTVLSVCLTVLTLFSFVGCGKNYSWKFLFEAYGNWIYEEDVKSIAYYANGGREGNEEILAEDFIPQAKKPKSLNALFKKRLRRDFYEQETKGKKNTVYKLDDVTILDYYGVYNDCIVVLVDVDWYGGFAAMVVPGFDYQILDGYYLSTQKEFGPHIVCFKK